MVTGVSGSGKTTMILESLIPGLQSQLEKKPLPSHVKKIQAEGISQIKLIDATPIGINIRSTVATYANIHDELRKIYVRAPLAKDKGFKAEEAFRISRKKKGSSGAGDGISLPALMELSVDEAIEECSDLPLVRSKLQVLHDIGLGYLTLGEESPGLSGGGKDGGRIVACGSPEEIRACKESLTGRYI